jgi:hypothetical protein
MLAAFRGVLGLSEKDTAEPRHEVHGPGPTTGQGGLFLLLPVEGE